MADELGRLIDTTPYLWRGNQPLSQKLEVFPSGYQTLDRALPSGGWPLGNIVELLPIAAGIGELRLLLPIIRTITRNQGYVVIINTPYELYTPALVNAGVELDYVLRITPKNRKDAFWVAEKALVTAACRMVLLWPDGFADAAGQSKRYIDHRLTRRLQVAARSGNSILMLYRFASHGGRGAMNKTPWATIRLLLTAMEGGLKLDVEKAIGSHRQSTIRLCWDDAS